MDQLNDLVSTLGGLPIVTLLFFIIFGAFALAAFAIHAVVAVVKRSSGE